MASAFSKLRDVILVQLGTRIITFVINVAVARLAPKSDYGVTFVSFHFFINLALFLSKECFRKVALKRCQDTSIQPDVFLRSSLNVTWFGVWLTSFIVAGLTFYWLYDLPTTSTGSYVTAVCLLSIAVLCESVAEPFLVMLMAKGDFVNKAVGEGFALFVRTAFMGVVTVALGDVMLAFASAQLVYGVIWLFFVARVHAPFVSEGLDDPLPAKLQDGSLILSEHKKGIAQFFGASLLKLALSEGEKPIVLGLFSEDQWGEFALVQNLGGLLLRLLFAPIEEVAYASFGQAHSAGALLQGLLFLQVGVGWIGLCFGPAFSAVVIRILYGSEWGESNAPSLLAAYCVQLLMMASNGILEGYLMARCSSRWMTRVQIAHVIFFGVFCGLVYLGNHLKLGLHSVIFATSVSMFLRCLLAIYFVRHGETPRVKEGSEPIPQEGYNLKGDCGKIVLAASVLYLAGQVCNILLTGLDLSVRIPLFQIGIAAVVAVVSILGVGFFAWTFCGMNEAVKLLKYQKQKT